MFVCMFVRMFVARSASLSSRATQQPPHEQRDGKRGKRSGLLCQIH